MIFVGSFIHRKGPRRVLEACALLPEPPKMVFVGSGSQRPEGEGVLYAGHVEHSMLPWYLFAADVFVLPTLSEGMPNAIIEAMACGVPIVTSAIPPNLFLLGEHYPLFANPVDIAEISQKIQSAYGFDARQIPKPYSIQERAKTIVSLMEDCL